MGRIRTVKPEFYLHEGLFDLETETGIPIRLAFSGLWTQCDRAGRFEWRPRRLKANILPYDDVDFSRVLDALLSRGFIVKYACPTVTNGRIFGVIPTWPAHQFINNREKDSSLPDPYDSESEILEGDLSVNTTNTYDACSTRADACTESLGSAQGEGKGNGIGKGREGEQGKEGNGKGDAPSDDGSPPANVKPPKPKSPYTEDFDAWWLHYPKKTVKATAFKEWNLALRRIKLDPNIETDDPKAYLLEAVTAFAASGWGQQREKCPKPHNWLLGGQYEDDRENWKARSNQNGNQNQSGAVAKSTPTRPRDRDFSNVKVHTNATDSVGGEGTPAGDLFRPLADAGE